MLATRQKNIGRNNLILSQLTAMPSKTLHPHCLVQASNLRDVIRALIEPMSIRSKRPCFDSVVSLASKVGREPEGTPISIS